VVEKKNGPPNQKQKKNQEGRNKGTRQKKLDRTKPHFGGGGFQTGTTMDNKTGFEERKKPGCFKKKRTKKKGNQPNFGGGPKTPNHQKNRNINTGGGKRRKKQKKEKQKKINPNFGKTTKATQERKQT